ncbi:hypothetical protein CLV67_121148 [Actinoplanes italicus]|uniref:Uncharacterized protein n=1 Tax=Actinoplanes italicus TaxID=113567 RepID=A0A2T0K0K0_9ACTN|nr:hypothetical protein CLV67_121148 [Actinoplanes italicus]
MRAVTAGSHTGSAWAAGRGAGRGDGAGACAPLRGSLGDRGGWPVVMAGSGAVEPFRPFSGAVALKKAKPGSAGAAGGSTDRRRAAAAAAPISSSPVPGAGAADG